MTLRLRGDSATCSLQLCGCSHCTMFARFSSWRRELHIAAWQKRIGYRPRESANPFVLLMKSPSPAFSEKKKIVRFVAFCLAIARSRGRPQDPQMTQSAVGPKVSCMDIRPPAPQPTRVSVYGALWCVTESDPHLSRPGDKYGCRFYFHTSGLQI